MFDSREGMYMLWTPIFCCGSFVYIVYANPQLASGLHLLLRDVSWICNTLGIGLDSIPPVSLVSICIQVVCTFCYFWHGCCDHPDAFYSRTWFWNILGSCRATSSKEDAPFFRFYPSNLRLLRGFPWISQGAADFSSIRGFLEETLPEETSSWMHLKAPHINLYIIYVYTRCIYVCVIYVFQRHVECPGYIYIYIYIHMIPVPRSRSPYGPLLPDLESFISMVFKAFWMQNLIFPWYLHQFGWKTSYFHRMYNILDAKPTYIGTKEYSYITSLYIYTYIHIFICTYIHMYIYTYIYIYTYLHK